MLSWGRVLKIKNHSQIKQNKPFEINDIFIYLIVIVSLFILFLSFVILPQKTQSNGFVVYKGQELVFTFYNDSSKVVVQDNFSSLVKIEQVQDGLTVKVFTDENLNAFNLVFINVNDRFAKMLDSTCSQSKDCVHSPSINDFGMIYCAPHELKIVPLGQNDIPPWTGGA